MRRLLVGCMILGALASLSARPSHLVVDGVMTLFRVEPITSFEP